MGGRAVEGTGLENRQGATPRGFESHPIRQTKSKQIHELSDSADVVPPLRRAAATAATLGRASALDMMDHQKVERIATC
jgi:hypothetical protein